MKLMSDHSTFLSISTAVCEYLMEAVNVLFLEMLPIDRQPIGNQAPEQGTSIKTTWQVLLP